VTLLQWRAKKYHQILVDLHPSKVFNQPISGISGYKKIPVSNWANIANHK
jgi:hypothetical protein